MALLSYERLLKLREEKVIENVPMENVNAASIDITLDRHVMVENDGGSLVFLNRKETLSFREMEISDKGLILYPGEFILASSVEVFNLPNNIAAEYKLKSSLARCGLNHMLAGWCDPGWTGSKLTLELHNCTSHHPLVINHGMKIGQMVFWECEEVPEQFAYGSRGQYNNQSKVTSSKGLR
jgi:dCTP deaminase